MNNFDHTSKVGCQQHYANEHERSEHIRIYFVLMNETK